MASSTTNTPELKRNFELQYQKLNPGQRQAVDAIEGVVMVLAGPGTGKTQVLAMRIANILLQTQMDPYNILCLTFTESGVAAMRKRLISIIGTAAYYVRIHTFHSFCNEVIQEYPEKFSFARELEVLSDIERVELFEEILNELPATSPVKPFGNPYLFLKDLAKDVQSLKAEHITGERYQQVVDETAKLLKVLKRPITSFTEKPAAIRTPEAAEQCQAAILKQRAAFPALPQQFSRLEKMYARLQSGMAAAENKREVGKVITKYKTELARWFDQQNQRLPKQREVTRVYELYQKKLKARGRYDYEDMLLFVVDRFKVDEELLARYQEQFQYILVDEYQDTNGAQNETVTLLGHYHKNPNIFVVGDDKQSIYRFQGASLENLLYLYERYRDYVQVIRLTENYRSQQTILDAASAVIAHNREAVDRYIPDITQPLKAASGRVAQPVLVRTYDTADTELFGVGKAVQKLLQQGVAPTDIAVLCRRNSDTKEVAQVMLKLELPVQLEYGHNILEDITIQQLISVLSYISAPTPPKLWAMAQYAFWGFSALDVVRCQQYAASGGLALFTVMSTEAHLAAAGVKQPQPFLAWTEKLATWQQAVANRPLQEVVAQVVGESGLLEYALNHTVDHLDVYNCLTTLFHEMKHANRRRTGLTVAEFLKHLELLTAHRLTLPAAPLQTKRNAVRVLTAHRAKGQEFTHVFVIRAIDHHWGNLREHSLVPLPQGLLKYDTIAGEENNEDERRLFFVAMTRARETLTLSYAQHSGGGREQVPAIFLEEIPTVHKRVETMAEIDDEAHERLRMLTVQAVPSQHNERLEAYIRSLLDHYVLNVTHLNNYLACPRLFYYRNLLRVPSVKTVSMAYGTAAHAALYDYGAAFTKNAFGKAELAASFERHLRREILTPQEFTDALAYGTTILSGYFDQYDKDCSRNNLLEYNFRSHGVTVNGIPISGMVDKIELLGGETARVVDYKTGNPDTKKTALRRGGEYHRQLVFYKLLGDNSPRFRYKLTSGEIDFVQKSAVSGAYVKQQYELTAKDTDALEKTITEVWQEMQALAFMAPENEKFCGKCEYCVLVAEGKLSA